MTLALCSLSAGVACLVYWVTTRLPLPPEAVPARRPGLLSPLEQLLQRELDQAGLRASGRLLLQAVLISAGVGALLAFPFASKPLMLISAAACGLVPVQAVRMHVGRRARAVRAAVEPALVHIALGWAIRRHPLLAITEALPLLAPPLRAEFELAVSQCRGGLPLPEALQELASRCAGDFYLHQLAELVANNLREGGDLGAELERLAARLRTMAELRAEETAKLSGYKWLTRILFAVSLAPLPYWAATRSAQLQFYAQHSLGKVIVLWVVVSGLISASLPYWQVVED
ncbi:MAG TPA: type II secretion system F family protein [Symbiobacteriaceae bacterium]|nr:type II secretion system F family protein [Symbiobacteriaceae bacterium]